MFTAGNDVGEFAAVATGKSEGSRNVIRFLHSLAHCTRPLVAAVQGRAVGVGTTMLLHCDLVVLADNAQLSTPFVSLALVPEAASSLLMPLRIGHVRAYEMFALGETVPAKAALDWGLASRVVPLDGLDAEAAALAQRLVRQPRRVDRHQAPDAQRRDAARANGRRGRAVGQASAHRRGPGGLHGLCRTPPADFTKMA